MRRTRRKRPARRAGMLLLCLCVWAAPIAVPADNPLYLPEAQQQAWAQRLAAAQQEIEQARQKVAELEAAYSEAQHSGHPRGEQREALEESLREARDRLGRLEQSLPELVEEARRAGVYPKLLRPYQGD